MSLLLTKIKVPQRRKDILRRQRLIDLLHQNIHRKVNYLSAPAGYGKTTLLIDFAHDIDAKVCWYRVDHNDVDLIPFVRYLVGSFQQHYPEFGLEILTLLDAGGGGLDSNGIAIELINEIVRQVTDFSVLILDDYHLIGEKQPIVDLIETILEYLPDQVRLLFASRSVYGIPAANLYVRDNLATIGPEEMRFRPEELRELVRTNYSVEMSDEQVAEIAKRADGWIVAILLALRALEQGIRPQFQQTTSEMYQFLAKDVVALQPEHLRDFLYSTSIFDEFNETICNYVLEIQNSSLLIQELEERNLFVTRIDAGQDVVNFRYHQLFSDFLSQALAEKDPQRKIELHRKAADWYYQHRNWENAINHLFLSGDRVEAALWINEIASELFVAGKTSVIGSWINQLTEPVDVRYKAPWLALNWAKVLYESGDYKNGDLYLEIAEHELSKQKKKNLLINLYITKGMSRAYQGKPNVALELAEQAVQLIGTSEEFKFSYFQAQRLIGITYRHLGRPDDGVQRLESAVNGFRDLITQGGGTLENQARHDLAEALNDLGIAHFENGNVLDAQKCLEEVLKIRRAQKSNLGGLLIALNNIGYLYYLLGRYRQAWDSYEEAYSIAISIRNHRGLVHIFNSRGDLLRDLDDFKAAEASYLEARRRAESTDHWALFATFIGMSGLERRRGNYHDALYWLREAARVRGQSVESADYQVRLGEIYHDMGQFEMAQNAFQQAILSWQTIERPNENLALAYFMFGATCFELDEKEKSLEFLRKSLGAAAVLGYDHFIVNAARSTVNFLQFAAGEKVNLPQLKNIIARVSEKLDIQILVREDDEVVEDVQLVLDVHAFGPGEVYRDGVFITITDWRSTNSRGLFFFIIDRSGMKKEDIALELWPDFSQAKATSNFHSTLWRVRNALGKKDAIIFHNNRYVLHPSIEFRYDVKQFETYIQEADHSSLPLPKKLELYRKALEVYRGDFLPDIPGEWVERRRKELQEKYLTILGMTGKIQLDLGNYLAAKEAFERILEVDPYRDDIHLEVMRCLVISGTPTAARAHFQMYRDFLWKELKAKPLPELQQFCDALP
jgi:LuxR family transcriptional regulator, maltose regulon positive regulatory protein